ncbi:DNA alkylation repair protein [bacterium]|nr:DNA alkylation repair protein [bacterium]
MAERQPAPASLYLVNRIRVVYRDVSPITKNARLWMQLRAQATEVLADCRPREIVELAIALWQKGQHNLLWVAVDLLHFQPGALQAVRAKDLELLAETMDEWWIVDAFAAIAGPMWRDGLLSDARIKTWAHSLNRWKRRATLVATVYLNSRSRGGRGDVKRTLWVCDQLKGDGDEMVVKGLSWALRVLIAVDRRAVARFLKANAEVLAVRVRREVSNKLVTGLKKPGSADNSETSTKE